MGGGGGMSWARAFFESGWARRVSALWGGLGVALGAFGAHAWRPVLAQRPEGMETWRTAVLYHLVHAVVLVWLAEQGGRGNRVAWGFFLAGAVGFSGSLYLLSGLGWRALGPVTPLGGVALLAGWGLLAWRSVGPKAGG